MGENNDRRFLGDEIMARPANSSQSFGLSLTDLFLGGDEDQFEELRPISGKEFYSALAILVAGLAAIALTIGPLGIR